MVYNLSAIIIHIVLSCTILYTPLTLSAQNYSDSITVNLFMLDECIISQNMTSEINRLASEFDNDSIDFVCYFSNLSSKESAVQSFMEKYHLSMPYKLDYLKERAKFLGATIAPEVVVYDEKNHKTLYKGRINNSYQRIGQRRRVTTENELEDVLTAIVKNNLIDIAFKDAIGCFINFKELK